MTFQSQTFRPDAPPLPDFITSRMAPKIAPGTSQHRTRHILGQDMAPVGAVMMQSNDYLGIARDARVSVAKSRALLRQGHGDAVSRVFAHHRLDDHRKFERRIAHLIGAEDSILCMSGYSANVGLIQALAQPDTPIYIDKMAHASLWEGIQSAGAKPTPFAHNDVEDLREKIAARGRGLIIVDAIYSQNGNICPLEDMVALAEASGSALIVDETHSFGCHGRDGAGLCVALGLQHRVHFRTIGLSKAVAARGGVIAGSEEATDFVRFEARPMIFSTSVLGYEIAGFNATLDIMRSEPWRRTRLKDNHRMLRAGLSQMGYDVGDSDSQILSIVIGSDEDTIAFRKALVAEGVVGSVFCHPAVPRGKAMIRLTVGAVMGPDDIPRVLETFDKLKDMPRLKTQAA